MAREHYFHTWASQKEASSVEVVSAQGFKFVLQNGEEIIDGLSTAFNTNFGYSEERIKRPVVEATNQFPAALSKWNYPQREEQSKRLKTLLGEKKGKIFYTVSGSESVENALKIVRDFTGRKLILARECSYHGATLGALSVSGDWRNKANLTVNEWTLRIPEPHDDPECVELSSIVERVGAENIAAICLETITGANGVWIAPESWWKNLKALIDKHSLLLISDEVLNGFRRCGSSFAFQGVEGLKPDLVCMSKGISGGYVPFGALWVGEEIASYYDENMLACGLTNYAHPLGIAAMSGVLDLLEDSDTLDRIEANELLFAQLLEQLRSDPRVKKVRSQGMLAAIETDGLKYTWKEFIAKGFHAQAKEGMIILAPPLTIDPSLLEKLFDCLISVLGGVNE